MKYFEAFGNVRLKYPDVRGKANYAYRDVRSDTLLLQENAYVKRRDDEFWAERIQVNLRTSEVQMTDNVRGELAPRNRNEEGSGSPNG